MNQKNFDNPNLNQIIKFYNEGGITAQETAIKILNLIPYSVKNQLKYFLNNEDKSLKTFSIKT